MITKYGSQYRDPIADTDYKVSAVLSDGQIILTDTTDGHHELWIANDDHSGYTIEYYGVGFEFIRDWDFVPQH